MAWITYTEAISSQQGTGHAITVAVRCYLFDWQRQIRQDANPVQSICRYFVFYKDQRNEDFSVSDVCSMYLAQ